MTDDERLAHVARRRRERAGLVPEFPGKTEFEALVYLAMWGGVSGWLGIGLAGAVFGLPFFIIGALFGGIIAAMVGVVTSLLAMSLFITLRGRLRMPTAMAWAGALSGIFSWGVFGTDYRTGMPLPTLDPFGVAMLAAGASVVGAIGGRWLASRALLNVLLVDGLGIRDWRQFSIVDLLLLTTWVAVVTAVVQGCWPIQPAEWPLVFIWLMVSFIAVGIVEGFVAIWRNNRSPSRQPT